MGRLSEGFGHHGGCGPVGYSGIREADGQGD
jgi:hypothetical protein